MLPLYAQISSFDFVFLFHEKIMHQQKFFGLLFAINHVAPRLGPREIFRFSSTPAPAAGATRSEDFLRITHPQIVAKAQDTNKNGTRS
jgi:hypothetical protein